MMDDLLSGASHLSDHVSDLALDRLRLGELGDAAAVERLRAHLAGCAACRSRQAELEGVDAAFPDEVAISRLAFAARRGARRRWLRSALASGAVAAAAALLLLVDARPLDGGDGGGGARGVRSKGGLHLDVFVKHAGGKVDSVLPGAQLHRGDTLRFRISSDRPGWVAVLGVNAGGAVSAYVPSDGSPLRVEAAPGQLLDGAVELDESVGHERIVAVLCPEARPLAAMVDGTRRSGKPDGCQESSFPIAKAP